MYDLNDLRVFESVGRLRSFSGAAKALGFPKSSVSRGIARLEQALGSRLIQRTTRDVKLTPAGENLMALCATALGQLGDALDLIGSLAHGPRGILRISAGIGFGPKVLGQQLPAFLSRYPDVHVSLDLTSRPADLVNEGVDVAIRLGPLNDSRIVAVRLGEMKRLLCASPAYLKRRGMPARPEDLAEHDLIEMPSLDGRPRIWSFSGQPNCALPVSPRIQVNDALTIERLITHDGGVGVLSGFICAQAIAEGALVHLLPEWTLPSLTVSLVFPSKRELSPTVRAFIDFMKEANPPGKLWQNNEPHLTEEVSPPRPARARPKTGSRKPSEAT